LIHNTFIMKHTTKKTSKLLEALKEFYPDSSNRTLQSWITHRRVLVNDQVVKKPHFIVEKDRVITITKKDLSPLPILYKDHHLVVIDKPDGLLSVPKDFSSEKNALETVKDFLFDEDIYPVHRLDQKTSGLLIFARTKTCAKLLSKAFKEHLVKRTYYAVCEGSIKKEKGTIKSFVQEQKNFNMRSVSSEYGKKAITHYQVVKKGPYTTHVKLQLETGKKHQIRLHMQELGHPILADKRYGSLHNPIKRLCLHAMELEFTHPINGKKLQFSSPIPNNFKRI